MSKKLGNENSYTKEFYEELYKKIKVTDQIERINLEQAIMLATQAYLRKYTEHRTQNPTPTASGQKRTSKSSQPYR